MFIVRALGKTVLYTLFVTAAVIVFFALIASQYVSYVAPTLPALTQLSELTTETWGIFDPDTGKILAGSDLDTPHPIASVTKLFTAEAVLESPKKEERFIIVHSDIVTQGRAGKLWYGDEVTPYELLFPLLMESSNDAAEAIRRELGSEYREHVDKTLADLSLTGTKIVDPSGLSSGNVSTVVDMSRYYADLRKRHPHIADITRLKMYIGPHAGYINNDPASSFESFTGGKHGFTDTARRTFVGTFTIPESGQEIGIVLLGSDDLRHDLERLLSYGKSIAVSSAILSP